MKDRKWICGKCGYEVIEDPGKNARCSSCGSGRYRATTLCDCGKWFQGDNAKRKYCSKDCGYAYGEKGGKKGKHYPHLQRARIATCPVCKEEFRATWDYSEKKAVYCSKACWNIRSTVVSFCEYCGAEIKSYKSAGKKFCSSECRDLDYRRRTGRRAAGWKGGLTPETKCKRTRKNYKEWRQAVFDRDGHKCVECGRSDVPLEAHHVKEVCNYPQLMLDVNNGLTLCHDCHAKTENYRCKKKKVV